MGSENWPDLIQVPITVKAAIKLNRRWHRHLGPIQGGLFAVAVARKGESEPCGVAIVGRPARVIQDGWTVTLLRCATDGTPNACSKLYSLARRAGVALGYRRMFTHTELFEPGTSLEAAGCKRLGKTKGGKHSRVGRPRADKNTDPKHRWSILDADDATGGKGAVGP